MNGSIEEDQLGVGLIGARGYAGRELLHLIARHPRLQLEFAASRSLAGRPIGDSMSAWPGDDLFVEATPATVADRDADVLVLALPTVSRTNTSR